MSLTIRISSSYYISVQQWQGCDGFCAQGWRRGLPWSIPVHMSAAHVVTHTRNRRETRATRWLQALCGETFQKIGYALHAVLPRVTTKPRVWRWPDLPKTNNMDWAGTRWQQARRVLSSMAPSCFSLLFSFLAISYSSNGTLEHVLILAEVSRA